MAKREGPRAQARRAQVLGRAAPPYPSPLRPSAHTSGGAGRTWGGGGADLEGPGAGRTWRGRRRGLRARPREVAGGPRLPREATLECPLPAGGNWPRRALWGGGARGAARGEPARAARRQVSGGEGTAGSGAPWGRSRARSVARAWRRRCCPGLPGRAPGVRGGGARAAPAPAGGAPCPPPSASGGVLFCLCFHLR